MTPSAIDDIFSQHPTGPLRITLSSGDHIDIPDATAAIVSISHLTLYPNLKRRFSADMGKYVSIVNIAMIDPIADVSGNKPSSN